MNGQLQHSTCSYCLHGAWGWAVLGFIGSSAQGCQSLHVVEHYGFSSAFFLDSKMAAFDLSGTVSYRTQRWLKCFPINCFPHGPSKQSFCRLSPYCQDGLAVNIIILVSNVRGWFCHDGKSMWTDQRRTPRLILKQASRQLNFPCQVQNFNPL